MGLTFAHFFTLTVHTHTCAHTQSDDKRGHGAGRAVIYTVSTPSGHDVHFQKHMCRVWLRTYSTCMCSLCQKLTCVCSLWKIYKRETPRVPMSVYLESVWGRGGGHLAACGTLSTCVLFPCGTQAQVRDASFTLMCHQSVKLETSQSATYPSTPPHTLMHTHTLTHIWTVL